MAMMSQFRNAESAGARGMQGQGQGGRAAVTAGAALRRRAAAARGATTTGGGTRGAREPEEKTTKQIKAGLDNSVRSCYYYRPDISNKRWFDMKQCVMLKPDWETADEDEK